MKSLIRTIISIEFVFVIFLMAGFIKSEFDFIPIDLTILTYLITVLFSLFYIFKKGYIYKSYLINISIIILFISWITFSILYSDSTVIAFEKSIRFIILTSWSYIGVFFIIKDRQSLIRFLNSILIISIIMGANSLFIDFTSPFRSVFGSNYLSLGTAASLGILIILIHKIPTTSIIYRYIYLVIAMLLLFSLVLSGGRMPVISLIISLLIYSFFLVKVSKKFVTFKKEIGLFIVFILLNSSALLYFLTSNFELTLFSRMELLFNDGGVSASERMMRYSTALNMFINNPILGQGIGSFGVNHHGREVSDYAHNIFLEIVSELGLIGLVILLLFLVRTIYIGIIKNYSIKTSNNLYLTVLVVVIYFLSRAQVSGDLNDHKILFSFLAIITLSNIFKGDKKK